MIYCDTSLLVSALTTEVRTDIAIEWLRSRDHRTLAISEWSLIEFGSAIALKERRGDLDEQFRLATELGWATLIGEFSFIEVERWHFSRAVELVNAKPRGLRAGDALHLAIVLDQGCDLATFDRDMADAARALGVVVHPG